MLALSNPEESRNPTEVRVSKRSRIGLVLLVLALTSINVRCGCDFSIGRRSDAPSVGHEADKTESRRANLGSSEKATGYHRPFEP